MSAVQPYIGTTGCVYKTKQTDACLPADFIYNGYKLLSLIYKVLTVSE